MRLATLPLLLGVFALASLGAGGAKPPAAPCKPDDGAGCKKACDAGSLDGCFLLAGMHGRGTGGVAKDVAKMLELLLAGCEKKHARSCGELGFLYDNGVGVEKNPTRAGGLYEKGCEGGYLAACVNRGTFLETRAQKGDGSLAAAAYKKACDGGEGSGCFNLGNLYRVGGVPGEAASLWDKGCASGYAPACFNLGLMRRNGDGVPKDEAAAKKLLARACTLGEKAACEAKPKGQKAK